MKESKPVTLAPTKLAQLKKIVEGRQAAAQAYLKLAQAAEAFRKAANVEVVWPEEVYLAQCRKYLFGPEGTPGDFQFGHPVRGYTTSPGGRDPQVPAARMSFRIPGAEKAQEFVLDHFDPDSGLLHFRFADRPGMARRKITVDLNTGEIRVLG